MANGIGAAFGRVSDERPQRWDDRHDHAQPLRYRQSQGGIVEVGCWAHARRNFFEARATDELRAHTALAYIRRLYAVERELRAQGERDWRELPRAERAGRIAADRQQRSLPVLQEFYAWLESESP